MAVSVAIVPLTSKSATSTFATSSLNVTRQVRLLALVGDAVGSWRSIDATPGAMLSTTQVLSFVPVGAVPASAVPSVSAMFWPVANMSVTVASRPARLPPEAVTS